MNRSKHLERDEEIIILYKSGLTMDAVSKITGIGRSTIDYRLRVIHGKSRSRSQSNEGKPKSEEHKAAVSRARIKSGSAKGERNPNWQGGITSAKETLRKCEEYKLWRFAVYSRDKFTCQICGAKGNGGYTIQAHHIKPRKYFPELTLAIDNGVTLCDPCHRLVHSAIRARFHSDELLETRKGNQQPSCVVSQKVQRLAEGSGLPLITAKSVRRESDDIVHSS